jgi:uncharacterized repeat protein (TIGR03803 family)
MEVFLRACAVAFAFFVPPAHAYELGFKVLHKFCARPDCADGGSPQFGMIADPAGNLYGTAGDVVFKLAQDGTEKVLYTFQGGTDGRLPGALTADAKGNLYGTTELGGTVYNTGTVFRIAPDGTKTTLYTFCA